ncbi:hypothetical protein [Natronosalvus vescus]|uniref:hypothetical protein n=1 Tax=Natronosalvus vescus TaxID=2953881 RepID=UPI002090CE8F|nr:hypothetical protein [Natronosalvus vescus]
MRRRGYLVGLGTGVGVLVSITGGTTATTDDLSVEIVETNDPVQAGEFLNVVAEVSNTTSETIEVEAQCLIGGESIGGRWQVTLEGGATRPLEFSHLTYPVRQDVEFPVRIAAGDTVDERTVSVTGIDDLADDRVRPGSQVSVTPGTTVTFEVEPDEDGGYGGLTHWYLDDDYSGWSMGPWNAEYFGWTGRDYWQYTFEEPGTYAIRASVVGEEQNATAGWTVEVDAAATDGPEIDGVSPAPGTLEATAGESVELRADVSDPAGALEHVVWWLGHADRVLDVTPVSGDSDTATLEVDGAVLCHGCPIQLWVAGSGGATARVTPWTVTKTDGGPLQASITETNAPVAAGEFLEVDVDLENTGTGSATREVELIVGDETVDSLTVTVDGGEMDAVTLGYETYPVRRNVEFPVWVSTGDDTDERTVSVVADGVADLDVRMLETNAPVLAGETLSTVADVENTGTASVSQPVHLVAGDRVASKQVELGPGDVETVELGYETYPVRKNVEFPLSVETDGACDRRLVRVFAEQLPSLSPTVSAVNDPVDAGEWLEVTVDLENLRATDVTEDVSLLVGGETLESESVTVAGDGTQTVTLGYETYPVRRDVSFPIAIEVDGERDTRTVEVRGLETDDGDGDEDEDGDDDDRDLEVDFVDCSRVEITGSFEDGDTISAHTVFNTDHGVGTTTGEDLIAIGDHVPAPFSGTIVFEIGDERGVSGDDSSATVTVNDYGELGTAITGISDPSAMGASTTHSNPHDCSGAIDPEVPSLEVQSVSDDDDGHDVTFGYTNPNDVSIVVGSSFTDGTADQSPPNELTSGSDSFTVHWTPQDGDERLEWTIDLSAFGDLEPVQVATEPASAYGEDDDDDPDPEAGLNVSIAEVLDGVTGGEYLEVQVSLGNGHDHEVTDTIELVDSGGTVLDSAEWTLVGESTEYTAFGWETHPVETDQTFSVTVRSSTDSDSTEVTVLGTGDDGDDGENDEDAEETNDTDDTDGTEDADDTDDTDGNDNSGES